MIPCRLLTLAWLTLALAAPPRGAAAPETPKPAPAAAPTPEPDEAEPAPAKPKAEPGADKFWEAVRIFRSGTPADQATARARLQESADLEYVPGELLLGECLLSGSYGFTKAPRRATTYFRLAAERKNGFAEVELGRCYCTGTGVSRDLQRAAEWLEAALTSAADYTRPAPPEGFAETVKPANRAEETVAGELETDPAAGSQATAHFLLALIREDAQDLAGAQRHYVQAAMAGPGGRAGIQAAALHAALNYAFGRGVPRDPVKANEMLTHARTLSKRMTIAVLHGLVAMKEVESFAVADLEEQVTSANENLQVDIQYQIAEMFAQRKSRDYNPAEAVKWYELAAEGGKAWAMLSLAFLYGNGDLGQPDPAKAFHWFEMAGDGENPKHFLAAANLAICLQNGLGAPKDPARAAAIYQRLRGRDFMSYLGSIGQAPARPVTFDQALALNQQWAEDRGDASAQYFLAVRYWRGDQGLKENKGRAVRLFRKAAKAGHGDALYELGMICRDDPDRGGCSSRLEGYQKAAEYFQRGMEAGNAQCTSGLAYLVDKGFGLPADRSRAVELYRRCLAMDPKSDMAHNNLAVILEDRLLMSVRKHEDPDSATRAEMLEHFEAADRLEDRFAPYNLGSLYRDGAIVKKDLQRAYAYFETAAERGEVEARFQVGLMLEEGNGVPVNYSEAAYHFRLAALDDHREALRHLANLYLTGRGVSQDFDRAAFWLERLARLGQIAVLVKLGDIALAKGDYADARKLFKDLADWNNEWVAGYACERLSRCYEFGWGGKPNPKRAQSYFDRAVKLGNGDALFRLAMQTMAAGRKPEALQLFERAAHSSSAAAFSLGQMYFFGTNVGQDRNRAYDYLRRAADSGNRDALYFLAAATFNRIPDAPAIDEAIRFAEEAESLGQPQAADLRQKLENRRRSGAAPHQETTGAHPG